MMNKASPTSSHLASTSEPKSLGQQQQFNTLPTSVARTRPPNLPCLDLINGSRENYLRNRMHLYNALRRRKFGTAKAILKENPELVRCSLTINGETALHIVATEKENIDIHLNIDTHVFFVRNLVSMMEEKDLELENQNYETAFFLAAKHGKVETAKSMLKKNRGLMTIPGDQGQMMPLYAAVLFGNYQVVKYLYKNSNELRDDDGWTTVNRGLLLEKCVEADMFGVALGIVKKYPELGNERILGILARKAEAFVERIPPIIKIIDKFAYNFHEKEEEGVALQILKVICEENDKKSENEIYDIFISSDDSVKEENRTTTLLEILIYEHLTKLEVEIQNIMGGPPHAASGKLHKALQLQKLIYEHLKSMHVETQNLINEESKSVFSKRDLQLQTVISQHLTRLHVGSQHIIKHEPQNENQALKLQELIFEQIMLMRDLAIPTDPYSFRMLFIAAEMGNTEFLVELINRYPDLIWKVNEENQTIFHIAVKYRHVDIYMLLYQLGSMRDLIACRTDANDNNMLHLVGKLTTKQRLAEVSGPALQMERELLWFQEVSHMIPINYRERKNKDGLTPKELFTEEHRQLVTEGERWLKETATQSMVVAALISAIVFAAAITVPGGYDQTYGIPIFYGNLTFAVFVVADAMSMLLSANALLTFLLILTSRYTERDFLSSLPNKLNIGLLSLLISVATMILTFTVSFFILYNKEWTWIPIWVSMFAFCMLLFYFMQQFDLIRDVIRLTHSSRYPFIHKKQFIYYANPRV